MSYEDNLIQVRSRDLKLREERRKFNEAKAKMKDVDKAIENALKPSKKEIIDIEAKMGLLKLEREGKNAEINELKMDVERLELALEGVGEEKVDAEVQTDIGAEFFIEQSNGSRLKKK